ncbi:hypothetical protein ACJROX_06435 [Pseudalkalibacillus sp. A8]|uniref:hypothetical protein n=1 Tax=Pseudalkalibacillus sp. A8 TaxID=3382641 RepID=UPI0038B4578C
MEDNTDKKILEELRSINQSLKEIMENQQEVIQPPILNDTVKSLFIGVFIVGPAIAILYGLFQILGSWMNSAV